MAWRKVSHFSLTLLPLMPLSMSVISLEFRVAERFAGGKNCIVKREPTKPRAFSCTRVNEVCNSPHQTAYPLAARLHSPCCGPRATATSAERMLRQPKAEFNGVTSSESLATQNKRDIKWTKNGIMGITYLIFLCSPLLSNFWGLVMLQHWQT